MGPPTLSVCLIARDEERLLPGCLESVADVADEIVLVDTGSTDRTPEIARRAGARIVSLPWEDDFAAPRTRAAREARGRWILQLDADERLAPGGAEGLRAAMGQGGFVVGLLRLHNAARADAPAAEILSGAARRDRPSLIPRLLANTGDVEYRGRIHENLVDWMDRHGDRRRRVEADLVHLGYAPEIASSRAKRDRNIALLRRRCAEEHDDPIPAGYLAFELMQAREFAGAEAVVERAWAAVAVAPPSHSILRLATARATLALRRPDPGGALDALERAEAREGPHPDLDYLRGFAREVLAVQSAPGSVERLEHLRRAEESLRAGLRRLDEEVWSFTSCITESSAHLHLSAVHLVARRPGEALEAASAALRLAPADPSAWTAAAESLLAVGQAGRALEAVQRALDERPDGWLVAAAAALELGATSDARAFLACAQARRARGLEYLHRVARMRQVERALGEAPR